LTRALTYASSAAVFLVSFFCSTAGPFLRPDLPLLGDAANRRMQRFRDVSASAATNAVSSASAAGDGHHRAFELPGLGELIERIGNRCDLIGLFRHAELRQHQSRSGGVDDAPGLARVIESRKMPQKQGQTRPWNLLIQDRIANGVHDQPINLTSEPCGQRASRQIYGDQVSW
jgi:hypothetical protein